MATTVEIDCGTGNDFDGRLGLRVSSIFVIGVGSLAGALVPVWLARTQRFKIHPLTFFITKYFGSGVIIATAFIHLSAPAHDALNSPCLSGPITYYSWPEGIMLMTIFLMFFIELLAARFEVFGHDHDDAENQWESRDPSHHILQNSAISKSESEMSGIVTETKDPMIREPATGENSEIRRQGSNSLVPDTGTYPPGTQVHLNHSKSHKDDHEAFAAEMTALFILEFGVIFHSVFIGLTLAVAGSEFNILYVVLVFHQTFEGLGLGSRLATASWPNKKQWMPWVLGAAYGFATPIAIAIGLGIRYTFAPGSPSTLVVNGVLDSISAGILIYTGLVELMAHEFMFNTAMRKASIWVTLGAFSLMCVGAGLMALLGKWA